MNKIKSLAVAVTLAIAAGAAHADIADATTGNGELFLSVYDSVAKVSYIRDLSIFMDDFLPTSTASAPGTTLTFSADSLLTSTFGSQLSSNPSSLSWVVGAMDNTGSGANGQRYLSTTNASLTTVKTQSNAQLTQFGASNDFLTASNGNLPGAFGDVAAAGSATAVVGDGFAYFENGMGPRWVNKSVFDATATAGQSMSFFFLTPSSTSGLAKASVTQYGFADATDSLVPNGNTFEAATWTLGTDGTLTYQVAAVPEAETWALFTAGLLMLGAVARRKLPA